MIGSGEKGIQMAVAMAKAGLHIDLIEKEPLLLNGSLNKEQSDALIKMIEGYNIKVTLPRK